MNNLTEQQKTYHRQQVIKHSSRAAMYPKIQSALTQKIIKDVMNDRNVSREAAIQILNNPL